MDDIVAKRSRKCKMKEETIERLIRELEGAREINRIPNPPRRAPIVEETTDEITYSYVSAGNYTYLESD